MNAGKYCAFVPGLISLVVFATSSFAEEAKNLLTKEVSVEVRAVIDAMLKGGFPDAKDATVYVGQLSVSAKFDPSKGMPLPSSASDSQMTHSGSPLMTYGYKFSGLHFKLADGSWIVSLSYHFKPGKDDKVNEKECKQIDVKAITADAAAAAPLDAEKQATQWLAKAAPAQRARCAATMNRLIPVSQYLEIGSEDMPVALLLLDRAGWGDAAEISLGIADQRSRNYWQLRPWTEAESAFDPTGVYPNSKKEQSDWEAAHMPFVSEPPADAFRRAMFRWDRMQIYSNEPEDALVSADVAIAIGKATLDPKDPQNNLARITALAASNKLPVSADEKADLPKRLQSWEARAREPRMVVAGNAGESSITTSFAAPVASYTPISSDLDALVQLLADERPSRFADFSGPRTLGDNAWRAVTVLLKDDPRKLAGHPTDKPWTSDERIAAAKAVQEWWKTHRGEFVDK